MLGFFRKKEIASSCFQIKVAKSNLKFEVKSSANLLDAAIASGIPIAYNCRVGACKTCQVKVLRGQARSLIEREYVFDRKDLEAGMYLACQTKVDSDLEIEWPDLQNDATHQRQTAYLLDIEQLTSRIYRIRLRLSLPVSWHAGQFAKLLPHGLELEPRSYSMVHDGQNETLISFDITRYPDGKASSWLTNTENLGKPVSIETPFGDFGRKLTLHTSNSPVICIAGGSGLGSIIGIIDSYTRASLDGQDNRPIILIVGARENQEIYGLNELRDIAAKRAVPLYIDVVLDREPSDSLWTGRRGYIADHLPEILSQAARQHKLFAQPSETWQALLCGPPPMVDSAILSLKKSGLQANQLTFDKYEQQQA